MPPSVSPLCSFHLTAAEVGLWLAPEHSAATGAGRAEIEKLRDSAGAQIAVVVSGLAHSLVHLHVIYLV